MDAIVWIVLAIIWFIAQVVTKARRSGLPRPPPVPRPTLKPIEEDLKELLQALSGQPLELPPEPPKPLPPVPYRVRAKQARHQPAHRTLAARAAAEPRPQVETPPVLPVAPAPEAPAFSKQLRTSFHVAAAKGLTLPRLPMLPRIMMGENIRYAKVTTSVHQQFKSRKGIAHAMISRVVLGPPKGLD